MIETQDLRFGIELKGNENKILNLLFNFYLSITLRV